MGQVVYLADRDLRPITDHLEWSEIDALAAYLEPGYGMVACPATSQVLSALQTPGATAVLLHDDQVFLAGPVERPHGPYEWTAGPGAGDPGQLKFHFSDYFGLVAGRRVYPDPAQPFEDQDPDGRYVQTAAAGTVLTDLVDGNAGPSAIAARRVPHLVIGSGAGIGSTITVGAQYSKLGDELRAGVSAAGDTGFRFVVDHEAREATFEAFEIVDRSAAIKFSRALGNLRAVTFETEIPRVTAALVAGGEGVGRVHLERVDAVAEAAYWRIEEFVDRRDTDDSTELQQAGDEVLVNGAAGSRLATVTIDLEDQRYGTHFFLSDFVTYEPVPGLLVVEQVRAAHLQATPPTGALLTTMVGTQSLTRSPSWLRLSRDLARRLARLEAI